MEINIGEIIVDEEINIDDITLDAVKIYPDYQELSIVPSSEAQVFEGEFNKVIVLGDYDLKPENISQNVNIFGVTGNAKITGAKITNTSYLFYYNARIDYVDELLKLCENVNDMSYMFYYCTNITALDFKDFNTSNVKRMNHLFYGCSNLREINLSGFDTANVIYMSAMFSNCENLENINLSNFNTANVSSVVSMFERCGKIKTLDLSNFDFKNVIDIRYIFLYDYNLTEFKSFKNLGRGYSDKISNYDYYTLSFSNSTKLTHDSLISIINNLYDLNLTYDVANGGTLYAQTLKLGSKNKSKLSEEEKAMGTLKGRNVTKEDIK